MISIIIPVFNTEKYLSQCLDSILHQSYNNWEAIIIDDGSTDNSATIYNQYKIKDSRIKIIKQSNQGVNKARQQGWNYAQGDWITFVDSDDTLPFDALENLVSKIDESTDIILGWLDNLLEPKSDILSIEEYRKRNIARGKIHVGPVAHLYRKEIFSAEVFDIPRNIYMGEDMLMNIRLSFRTNKNVRVINKIVYNYFINNPTNTTNSFRYNIQYEELLHKYRLLSIPQEVHSKYMNEMINIRLYSLILYITQNPFKSDWKSSIFFKELINDINSTHHEINKSTLLLLKSKSAFSRLILIGYRKTVKHILRFKSHD